MPRSQDFAQLNRRVRVSIIASVGLSLAGLSVFVLDVRPSLFGVSPEHAGDYQGKTFLLLAALVLTLAGIALFRVTTRWTREVTRVVRTTLPRAMTVKMEVEEDAGDATYYAVLTEQSGQIRDPNAWRAQIWIHPSEVEEDVGRQFEGNVYFHPDSGRPVAIEYDRGVLWVIGGSGGAEPFRAG